MLLHAHRPHVGAAGVRLMAAGAGQLGAQRLLRIGKVDLEHAVEPVADNPVRVGRLSFLAVSPGRTAPPSRPSGL